MLLKELKEYWFCDKLLETSTHAKENNATNMGKNEKKSLQSAAQRLKTHVFKVQNMCNAPKPRFEG